MKTSSTLPGILRILVVGSLALPGLSMAEDAAAAASRPPQAIPSTPQAAQAPSLDAMILALSQFLSEEEMRIIYNYLWDSAIATLKGGEEATLPPDLAFKLEVLMQRIRKEGGYYLQSLAKQMEEDLARNWQQRMTPSPPVPYTPPPIEPWR